MKTYIIVEDEAIISLSLVKQIENMPDRKVIGTASGEDVGFELIQKLSPDFVLTDISLLQGSGISLINRIRVVNADIRFLIMTGYNIDLYRKNLHSMERILIASKPIFNLDSHLDLLEKI